MNEYRNPQIEKLQIVPGIASIIVKNPAIYKSLARRERNLIRIQGGCRSMKERAELARRTVKEKYSF